MADSLWESCLDAVVASCTAAALPGIAGRVYKTKMPDMAAKESRCVLCSLEGMRAEVGPLDTESDEWVLPVSVKLLDRSSRRDNADLARWLSWQQSIKAAFLMQLFDDVPTCWHVDIRPLEVIDAQTQIGPGYLQQEGSFVISPRLVVPRVRE